MRGSATELLGSATHRVDDSLELLGHIERDVAEVSDRLADEVHAVVRAVEQLHARLARAWATMDGVA